MICRYGIQLEKLEKKHIEMVRQWRNNDFVRTQMQYREIITKEAQENWFAGLDEEHNRYFLALYQQHPFGLFHIKNIDGEQKKGESGGFVCNKKYVAQPVTALAILALMDHAFFVLDLNILEAKYNPRLKKIAALNEQLGYKIFLDEQEGFVRAAVTAECYLEKTKLLRKAAERYEKTTF